MSEIGPISEAMIGATQAYFPQQGFVDHVITPSIGLGWIIAEDVVDTYIAKPLEGRIRNPYFKLLIRGGLNPSRSLANVLGGRVPWARDTRGGVFSESDRWYKPPTASPTIVAREPQHSEQVGVPPFEFSLLAMVQQSSADASPCAGGGADAALRLSDQWQMVFEVTGCGMGGLPLNHSGDALNYMVGPRWVPSAGNRWSPYVQVLAGGQRLSWEVMDPAAKAALEESYKQVGKTLSFSDHQYYTSDSTANTFALKAGAGVDLKLNAALAVRMIGVDYVHAAGHPTEFQVTGGLNVRFGTW
jgi:hypothetical protein